MTTQTAPRQITPAKLTNSDTGSWLRTWTNGKDLMVRDEEAGRWIRNPARLSANVYRTRGRKGWTVRLFTAGEYAGESSVVHEDVWTLRMARQMLAFAAADWNPDGTSGWYLLQQAQDVMHRAWLEAADVEIDLIGK